LSGALEDSVCGRVRLLKPLILASSGRLYVTATSPKGYCSDERVREIVCGLLRGFEPSGAGFEERVKALTLFYGGLDLFYGSPRGPVLISRLLPEWPLDFEEAGGCVAPTYSVENLLDEWSRIAEGAADALERLGRCTLDPPGYRVVVGRGEPLPPTGVLLAGEG